ncbi:hypothetical protein BVRB_4g078840 isoform B [Beta vulgaris subsp. vulgaris]|nr:hypothetical protein BVRB_4g078840 isoform B [Beta vulgaris subsp. vulgaris]
MHLMCDHVSTYVSQWGVNQKPHIKGQLICIKHVSGLVKDVHAASTAGFEPARAKPNRFQVCLLNHSDISTFCVIKCGGKQAKHAINDPVLCYHSRMIKRASLGGVDSRVRTCAGKAQQISSLSP